MPTRRDFLEAIAAAPDDDLPRLVFADWLEEGGEHRRAEFIRVQCELARLPAGDVVLSKLAARESWLQSVVGPPPSRSARGWRRGFPAAAVFTAEKYLAEIEAALDADPPTEVTLEFTAGPGPEDAATAARLVASPRLRLVTGVRHRRWDADPRAFAALLSSPHLSRLRQIEAHVDDDGGAAVVRAVCDSPTPFRLTRLVLHGPDRPRDRDPAGAAEAARRIAAHPKFAALESLGFYDTGLAASDLDALAVSATLSRTLKLEVSDEEWD